jgi:hypothetical protein
MLDLFAVSALLIIISVFAVLTAVDALELSSRTTLIRVVLCFVAAAILVTLLVGHAG